MNGKVHASMSITLRAYRAFAESSRHAYHFKNPTISQKVQVILPLSFCHMLKRSKDIESDMLGGGLVFLFRAVNGKRGTVAEIGNAQAKSISTFELCHIFVRQIL